MVLRFKTQRKKPVRIFPFIQCVRIDIELDTSSLLVAHSLFFPLITQHCNDSQGNRHKGSRWSTWHIEDEQKNCLSKDSEMPLLKNFHLVCIQQQVRYTQNKVNSLSSNIFILRPAHLACLLPLLEHFAVHMKSSPGGSYIYELFALYSPCSQQHHNHLSLQGKGNQVKTNDSPQTSS